jgi:hypothetical protein
MMPIDQSQITIDDLPASTRDLAGTIGIQAVLKLIECYGGTENLYVPKRIEHGHPLVKLIGSDAVEKLAHLVGGQDGCGGEIDIPKGHYLKIKLRHKKIKQEKEQGASTAELAKRHDVTPRQIRRIVNR